MCSIVTFYIFVSQSCCFCLGMSSILKTNSFIDIRQSQLFVDKTLLIYKTLSNEDPLVLTAPQGFGKSTNLDMMRNFLSNTIDSKEAHELFADTDIFKDKHFVKTHLGNHPVIHCSFELTSPVTDYHTMITKFRTSLHTSFLQHKYLAHSSLLAKSDLEQFKKFMDVDTFTNIEPSELSSGLNFLSKVLKIHHGKPVILLIDDYDSVIWDSVFTTNLGIREALEFYNRVLNKAVNDKDNVKKSIITGTSCIFLKLMPDVKTMKCVQFLHDRDFEPFFGLTGNEVDYLADKTVYVSLRPNLTEWYDGYTSPDLSAHIYNTKSLMSFILLSEGLLSSYWENKKISKSLRILLEDSVRKTLLLDSPESLIFVVREIEEINEGMLEGVKKMVVQEIWDADVSDLYIHLLMEQGYFTFDKPWERSGYNTSVTFKLANLDICGSLQKFIINFNQELKRQRSNINIV